MMQYVLTAQRDALRHALVEAGSPRVVKMLAPGVACCDGYRPSAAPIFLRHVCPVQVQAPLHGSQRDLDVLAAALEPLLVRLTPSVPFSVQARIFGGQAFAYQPFDVNNALAAVCESAGMQLDVRAPGQVVSAVLEGERAYLGVSTPQQNLSAWAGGCRRFQTESGQVSRAEFKLLEALEVFALQIPQGGTAVDLGAAPGGWTRVLRARGFHVLAVDPALLDPAVAGDAGVTHMRETAQAYFLHPTPCDLMVNDMRMDCAASARLMVEGAQTLVPGGIAVWTLKLPENAANWPRKVRQAAAIVQERYDIVGIRQLFHNRCEVTAALRRR